MQHMNYLVFEDDSRLDLLPLTFTRPVWDLRCGILTMRERWARFLHVPLDELLTLCGADYLKPKYQQFDGGSSQVTGVNGKFFPNQQTLRWLGQLPPDSYVTNQDGELLAFRTDSARVRGWANASITPQVAERGELRRLDTPIDAEMPAIRFPWDIFRLNRHALDADFGLLTAGRRSQPLDDPHTVIYGKENIFLEEGAQVRAAILNATKGPIYLGKHTEVQEGAILSGAHAILDHSIVNVGAKLRGDTTVGPGCKVGGEVSNSVFWGYSNKGHDGFVGNSVIGEWCNLGADTNTSNLKNNYGVVKVYSHRHGRMVETGLTFCGLAMGDHSKCGINTMFNTGTVVGVFANVFGAGFPPKFVRSFAWGGTDDEGGGETFLLDKAFQAADRMMRRRDRSLTDADKSILKAVLAATR